MKNNCKYICWFDKIGIQDVPVVGEKDASLGEMYRELTLKGTRVTNGLSLTADFYWDVLKSAGILDELMNAMSGLDKTDILDLAKRGKRARDLIISAGIPEDIWREIKTAYDV
jgi:pyruvate, water dikinase